MPGPHVMPDLAPSLSLSLTATTATASLASVPSLATSALSAADISSSPPPFPPPIPSTMAGWIGWVFNFAFQVIPRALYWLVTFTTISLPTWLFTLFSMSLTFTMNFTTL